MIIKKESDMPDVLIEVNKKHQFKNPFNELFEFICIVINPEKVN